MPTGAPILDAFLDGRATMYDSCKRWICMAGIALAGCATAPPPPPMAEIWADERFGAPTVRVDREQVFEVSDAMRAFVRSEVLAAQHLHGSREGLYRALRDGHRPLLVYDAERTRNAAQAFEARAGNCLSLVVMTAAMAQELGLRVYFQSVPVDDVWSRSSRLVTLSGHVNVTLTAPLHENGWVGRGHDAITIDFIEISQRDRLRAIPVSEDGIVAMFMNNLAVEALERGELDNAYALIHAALRADPRYLNALNSLAVIYRRHGDADLAERTLRKLLSLQPHNTQALSNLSLLLSRLGRKDEAMRVEEDLRRLQPDQPFADFERGLQAAREGDWQAARVAFERELKKNPEFHELQYWLAKVHYELGDRRLAAKYMEGARDQALTADQRKRYTHKLEVLQRAKGPGGSS